jgi:hypothetical protein
MYAFIRSRRANSKGVSGALRAADAPQRPLARRRWDADGPVDQGILPWFVTRRADVPDPSVWARIDDPNTEHVEVHSFDDGWYQHFVVVPSGYTTVWARIELQLAERVGDDRTRVFAVSDRDGGLLLGVYFNNGQIEIADEVAGTSQFGGAVDVSNTWRRLKVEVVEDSGAGDGALRVYLDGAATADVVLTGHAHAVVGQRLLYGLGSVGTLTTAAQHTMRLANLELFAVEPGPKAPALSTQWAAAEPFQEVVDPLSAISLSPNPMSAQDGAAAGTVIGQLSRTGGRGDGTWSLTGDLAAIATINGTNVELTTTVDTATHDGTTGTISYTGDSAGGSASDISASLSVTTATTSLTLTAAAGGAQQSGTLDTSQPFQRLQMLPPAAPWMASQGAGSATTDLGYAGSRTRCGLDAIQSAADAAIIHVTSLDGGTGTGTLRWAASTTTDNQGNDISGKPVIVVFDVSGHIKIDGGLRFNKPNRWFAGQTAPGASNGSGSIFVHGYAGGRDLTVGNVIIEHLRFIDGGGNIDSNDTFEISNSGDIDNIIIRNCGFYWGVDETVAHAPSWSNKSRTDHISFIDCLNVWPTWFSSVSSDQRAKAWFVKYGVHRLELVRNFVAGGKGRNPGMKPYTSVAFVNHWIYDCQYNAIVMPVQDDWWSGDYPVFDPNGMNFYHVGGHYQQGPSWGDTGRNQLIQHYDLPDSDPASYVRHTWADEFANGTPASYPPKNKHIFYDAYTEPVIWPRRAPLPSEDVEAFMVQHCGPWPGDRCAMDARAINTWQSDGSMVYDVGDGVWRAEPSDMLDETIADTTGQSPSLPANPFDPDTNGLTVIENWLEQQHIAVGGAPYEDFGRWVRFPWGGRVKIETTGAVTYDPVDAHAGTSGTVEVMRADGSVVTATCQAS